MHGDEQQPRDGEDEEEEEIIPEVAALLDELNPEQQDQLLAVMISKNKKHMEGNQERSEVGSGGRSQEDQGNTAQGPEAEVQARGPTHPHGEDHRQAESRPASIAGKQDIARAIARNQGSRTTRGRVSSVVREVT